MTKYNENEQFLENEWKEVVDDNYLQLSSRDFYLRDAIEILKFKAREDLHTLRDILSERGNKEHSKFLDSVIDDLHRIEEIETIYSLISIKKKTWINDRKNSKDFFSKIASEL